MHLQNFIFFFILKFTFAFDNADVAECLLDLNMSELLRLRHSIERMEADGNLPDEIRQKKVRPRSLEEQETISKPKQDDESCASQNCLKPVAMALTGIPRSYYDHGGNFHSHSHHHHQHPWQPEEKPSKLTTLFNITVTTLALLAFGGYLVCLIVHAIKTKGATFLYPVTTTEPTGVDGGIRKIKVYRRGRRALKEQPVTTDYGELYKGFGETFFTLGSNKNF